MATKLVFKPNASNGFRQLLKEKYLIFRLKNQIFYHVYGFYEELYAKPTCQSKFSNLFLILYLPT